MLYDIKTARHLG